MIIPLRAGAGYGFGVPMLLLLALFCVGAYADLGYRANAVHPGKGERVTEREGGKRAYMFIIKFADYPGQCYFEELRQAIPKLQSYKPINREGHCKSIYCRPDYVLEIS